LNDTPLYRAAATFSAARVWYDTSTPAGCQALWTEIPLIKRECRGPRPSAGGLGVSPKFSLSFFASEGGEL